MRSCALLFTLLLTLAVPGEAFTNTTRPPETTQPGAASGVWESDFVVWPLTPAEPQLAGHIVKDKAPPYNWRTFSGREYVLTNPTEGRLSFLPPPLGCDSGNLSLPSDTAAATGGCDVATNAGFYDVQARTCLGYTVSGGAWAVPARRAARVEHPAFGVLEGLPAGLQDTNVSGFLAALARHRGARGPHSALVYGFINATTSDGLLRPYLTQLMSGQVWLLRDGTSAIDTSLARGAGPHDFFREPRDAEYFRNLVAPRLAIGHDGSGNVRLVAVDGYDGDGLTLDAFATVLIGLGLVGAINLDGGGSVAVFERSHLVNVPSNVCADQRRNASAPGFPLLRCPRPVASALCLKLRADLPAAPNPQNDVDAIEVLAAVVVFSVLFTAVRMGSASRRRTDIRRAAGGFFMRRGFHPLPPVVFSHASPADDPTIIELS